MFIPSRPNHSKIKDFLAKAFHEGFSYSELGATKNRPPERYIVDHNRLLIGYGPEDWENAKNAVRQWKMFHLNWVELHRADTPIEKGRDVAVLVSHVGFYSLNAARIVYTVDEPDRFGFAYGTLESHVESGEERFLVERDPDSGETFYDLYAFSRPSHILARIGRPYARHLQKRFATDSMAAMLRAVDELRSEEPRVRRFRQSG